ncbi:MAG: GNAT family N-acetyltransferase [Methanomethylophilus sp.]|jgi:GNAT superfamily N-acetyltransferase
MVSFVPVKREELPELRGQALALWREQYDDQLDGGDATAVRLFDMFVLPPGDDGLPDDQGERWFWIMSGRKRVGYCAYAILGWTLCASKIYIYDGCRNHGYGRAAAEFMISEGRKCGCTRAEIHANSRNERAIAAYHRWGFRDICTRLHDYGGDLYFYLTEMEMDLTEGKQ